MRIFKAFLSAYQPSVDENTRTWEVLDQVLPLGVVRLQEEALLQRDDLSHAAVGTVRDGRGEDTDYGRDTLLAQ